MNANPTVSLRPLYTDPVDSSGFQAAAHVFSRDNSESFRAKFGLRTATSPRSRPRCLGYLRLAMVLATQLVIDTIVRRQSVAHHSNGNVYTGNAVSRTLGAGRDRDALKDKPYDEDPKSYTLHGTHREDFHKRSGGRASRRILLATGEKKAYDSVLDPAGGRTTSIQIRE